MAANPTSNAIVGGSARADSAGSRSASNPWLTPAPRGSRGRSRPTEYLAVAEHGDRTVLAHGEHGGVRIVVAVATTGRVPGATERVDRFLGRVARHQPYAQPAQHTLGVEDRGAVDLGEGVAQR